MALDEVILWEGVFAPVERDGACCRPDASCIQTDQATCEAPPNSGEYQGNYTLCSEVLCCPDPFADADGDTDVDQEDFAALQACFTGAGESFTDANCECFDRDNGGVGDGDIDQDDWGEFEACATGPDVAFDHGTPPPGCVP